MFEPPRVVESEVYTRLPDELRILDKETQWSLDRGAGPLHSFLEGPAFDRAGNFYCVDLCHSRIFRITRDRKWEVFAEYDGFPNGLKIHRDGRIFVVDRTYGVSSFDPHTGARTLVAGGFGGSPFVGLNDLVFADNGDLYFTDPGHSSLKEPTGRVYRLNAHGEVELIADGLAYPNGLVLAPDQKTLYVASTASLQVLSVSLTADGVGRHLYPWRLFLQLSGGLAGPDGLAVDEVGNLIVAHSGLGAVWIFSRLGEPLARIVSAAGIRTTNVAFGGDSRTALYVTESEQGVILQASLQVPGRLMYSHR